jgi:nucleoside-diphosphate-sugar epimerase
MSAEAHIVLTGGAGYIGSMLLEALLRRGNWVTVIDTLEYGGSGVLPHSANPRLTFMRADIDHASVLQDAVKRASQAGAPPAGAVVHLAAIVGYPACKIAGEERVWRTNVAGLKRSFDAADSLRVERFIFASTYSVYGSAKDEAAVTESAPLHPQSLYAESKIAGETFLREQGADAACAPLIFRFSTLYGLSPRMRFDLIINQFVLEAHARGELIVFEKKLARSFVHIQDVVRGILLGLDAGRARICNQTINLGDSNGNLSKDEIVAQIVKQCPGTRVLYKELAFAGDMRSLRVSFDSAAQVLGFSAQRRVADGIAELLESLRGGLFVDPFAPHYRNAPQVVGADAGESVQ